MTVKPGKPDNSVSANDIADVDQSADPFDTAALRESTLRVWRDSPTRFIEDTNSERDLRVGGYRDRLLVELAQNAADAATAADVPGILKVSVVDGELRVANTGAPLAKAGVDSLSSLRASAKPDSMIGRFGVGFAAVLAVSVQPRILSRTGGIAFSESRTRQVFGHDGEVPVLRLPWPVSAAEPELPTGFDTEVRLPLTSQAQDSLEIILAGFEKEAADLLLALPRLAKIEIGDKAWVRDQTDGDVVQIATPEGLARWLTHSTGSSVWAIPLDSKGTPEPLDSDVLHTPTLTDERLSLPARLIARVPSEPSRRRVLPGEQTDAVLRAAAAHYSELARKVSPEHLLSLVPKPGFPLSEVDELLRASVTAELGIASWLPTVSGQRKASGQVRVLEVDSPELIDLLGDFIPNLLPYPLCGREPARTLSTLGVETISIVQLVDLLSTVDQDPSWWKQLYAVFLPLLDGRVITADDLGALPIPLADGRTLPGPRGTLLFNSDEELASLLSDVDIVGLRLVHPDAAHPLLERLGSLSAEPSDLLEAAAVRAAVESSVDDQKSGLDVTPLVTAVLRLVRAAGVDAMNMPDRRWLGGLVLPGEEGWRRADELVLPSSPLRDLFDSEVWGAGGPVDVLDATFARQWPAEILVAVGVLDTFAVIVDQEPVEPDHGLPNEEQWWDSVSSRPAVFEGIRDLDLIADDAWPAALRLLASQPETWRALRTDGGYVGWWISRFADLQGQAPRDWRLPSATGLTGLFDPLPELDLSPELQAMIGVRGNLTIEDAADFAEVMDRLTDPRREVSTGLSLRAYSALSRFAHAESDHDELLSSPVAQVRVLDGSVVSSDDCLILDRPWLAQVFPPSRTVSLGFDSLQTGEHGSAGFDDTEIRTLAELLDLPIASEQIIARIADSGEFVAWVELPAIGETADLMGLPVPDGGVVLHELLAVQAEGIEAETTEAFHDGEILWWYEEAEDRVHAEDSSAGLARAFAWATSRWADRHKFVALLDDPMNLFT